METKECGFSGFKMNGFLALFLHLVVLTAVIIFGFIISVPTLILSVCLCLIWFIMFAGYMELEPNEARAMVFFGKYKGTFKETGFFWVNPFLNKKKLSLRARNLDVEPIKVNDKIGNPILIGLVLVWKLKDTYKAMFEIDSQTMAASAPTAGNANQVSLGNAVANRMNAFENFVMIQSDAALRQVAGQYAYDDNEADTEELTLRSGGEEINEQLEQKLNERLAMAGMEVVEARINYLAYAPEKQSVGSALCGRGCPTGSQYGNVEPLIKDTDERDGRHRTVGSYTALAGQCIWGLCTRCEYCARAAHL